MKNKKDSDSESLSIDLIVDEIIEELPLKDRVSIANMEAEDVKFVQKFFGKYLRSKTSQDFDDNDYYDIIYRLWKKLHESHKIRLIK